jgi:hypothetical protein
MYFRFHSSSPEAFVNAPSDPGRFGEAGIVGGVGNEEVQFGRDA